MKKKALLFVTVLAMLACLFALSVSAAEPSTSDDFGEVTILDHADITKRNDYGYSTGDTAKIVVNVPNTDTYLTYPTYYFFDIRYNSGEGDQPVPNFTAINTATGYEFNLDSIVRLELPNAFSGVSTNFSKSNSFVNLKYLKMGANMRILHSGAFKNLAKLETVIFEDNDNAQATLSLGYSAFGLCTALTEFTFPAHLTYLGERALEDCTSLKTVTINARLDAIGTASFLNCTALETVIIPEDNSITRIKHRAFDNCKALTGTYVFNNVTHIESSAFKSCSTNDGTYLSVSFPAIVDFGCTGGDSHVFSDSGVCEVSLGENLASLSLNSFTRAKSLWRIEFEGCAEGFEFKGYTFEDCSALKAVSLPEGITTLPSRMFKYCSSLTAVYIPSTVTKIDSGDNDHATFKGCSNLYFVAEPFTYKTESEIPTEPAVYKFPSGIVTINSEAFDNSRINDVVVLPKGLTSLTQGFTFEGCTSASGTPTVVFLGDMTTVNVKTWGVSKIYFCNPADVDYASAGATNDKRMVFCYAEGNAEHLKELSDSREATCESPKITADFCFCGQFIPGTEVTEGDALGHNYTGKITYTLGGIMEEGTKCTVCVNNCGKDSIEVIPPVYVALGYSKNTFSNAPYSFVSGYDINRDALKIHEEEKGITIKLGFAFNSAETFTDGEVSLDSFALKAEVNNQTTDREFGRHEFVISYTSEEHLAKDIVIGAYAVEIDAEKNKSYYFINRSEDTTVGVNGFATVNYNGIE